MIKDIGIYVGLALSAIGGFLLVVAMSVLPFWLVVSIITSAAKAVTEQCGTTWKIEPYVQGDWFCPKGK